MKTTFVSPIPIPPPPLPLAAARRFAILTCLEGHLDPTRLLGLDEGAVHLVRSPGDQATDAAIEELLASHAQLGTREWFVIRHTGLHPSAARRPPGYLPRPAGQCGRRRGPPAAARAGAGHGAHLRLRVRYQNPATD